MKALKKLGLGCLVAVFALCPVIGYAFEDNFDDGDISDWTVVVGPASATGTALELGGVPGPIFGNTEPLVVAPVTPGDVVLDPLGISVDITILSYWGVGIYYDPTELYKPGYYLAVTGGLLQLWWVNDGVYGAYAGYYIPTWTGFPGPGPGSSISIRTHYDPAVGGLEVFYSDASVPWMGEVVLIAADPGFNNVGTVLYPFLAADLGTTANAIFGLSTRGGGHALFDNFKVSQVPPLPPCADELAALQAELEACEDALEIAEDCIAAINTHLGTTGCEAASLQVIYIDPGTLQNQQGIARNPNAGTAALLVAPGPK